ncbi:MAG: hypothetical protein ACJ8GJ_02285 [Vitreoscilla sp.]
MFNTKRKRAVVLALIAFFCGATAYVEVDWKRFGGGFLAFLKPKGEPVVAHAGGNSSSGAGVQGPMTDVHPDSGRAPLLASVTPRRHASKAGGGSGKHPSDDDLFKYGDPAAGGIPPGSFVVAQNDPPAAGGAAGAPSIDTLTASDSVSAPGDVGGGGGGGGANSPAPAPGGNGGSGDGGLVITKPAPAPPVGTPPSPATPPAPTPAAPTPPIQSGTTDNPGDGGTPVVSPPPVSAVPEASNAAMMGLGALFLAVAATRKRKNG